MDEYTEEERAFAHALGRVIASRRIALSLSQDELAARAGIGKRSLVRYELGERDPQLRTLRALAKALRQDALTMWDAAERLAATDTPPADQ